MADIGGFQEHLLHRVALFEKCSPEDIQRLALSLRWRSYKKGETVLLQGMIVHQIFFVQSGQVGVYARQNRETRRVALLGPGDHFGEISLIKNGSATATVRAEEDDTQILSLERDALQQILERNPPALLDLEDQVRRRVEERRKAFETSEEAAPAAL